MIKTLQSALASTLALTVTMMAAAPPIGVVQASGEFRLNHSAAYGNATLFDGSVIETGTVRSDLTLSSGGRLALGPNSSTQVFKTYAVLQSGAADVNAPGYKLKAASLSISGSGAQVVLDSKSKVRIGAMSSPVEVRNSGDMLIAKVFPGHPLEFDNAGGQGGASGPVTVTGTVVKQGDTYTITDDTTNVTYQLQGSDVSNKNGKKVKVVGAIAPNAAAGSVPVIAVSSISTVGAAGAGLSAAAITGIVIGGAAATGLGIAAAVGAFDSSSSH